MQTTPRDSVLTRYRRQAGAESVVATPSETNEMLRLLCDGLPSRVIAERLLMPEAMVRNQLCRQLVARV